MQFKPGIYKTRDGSTAHIGAVREDDPAVTMPLVGYIEGQPRWNAWTAKGQRSSYSDRHKHDLMPPPPPTRKLWVNVYKDGYTVSHTSQIQAEINRLTPDGCTAPNFIACLEVDVPA